MKSDRPGVLHNPAGRGLKKKLLTNISFMTGKLGKPIGNKTQTETASPAHKGIQVRLAAENPAGHPAWEVRRKTSPQDGHIE